MKFFITILIILAMSSVVFPQTHSDLVAQYDRVQRDLHFLRELIGDYVVDNDCAPAVKSLSELMTMDLGNGLNFTDLYCSDLKETKFSLKDPWGNPYLYQFQKSHFYLGCGGSDGKFKSFAYQGVYLSTPEELPGKDIIMDNNGLVYFPVNPFELQIFQMYINGIGQWMKTVI